MVFLLYVRRYAGNVTWVGSSSMEVCIEAESQVRANCVHSSFCVEYACMHACMRARVLVRECA